MKTNIKYIFGVFFALLLAITTACTEETYSLGDLKAPTNVVINVVLVGKDAAHPNGDGSGEVKISMTGDNVLGYKIDFDDKNEVKWEYLPTGATSVKYDAVTGVNTYRVTVVASGAGGTSTNLTKDITVRYDFTADPVIVTNITNNASKTWIVDKSVAGHLGVGPWTGSVTPEWWAAGIDEKVTAAPCLYTSTFTFIKSVASGTYSLTVATPDGAFTKPGSWAGGLPGISDLPTSTTDGCFAYSGGTSAFLFAGATSKIPAATPSTQTTIKLSGIDTYIGYGSTLKEYEIMVSTPTYMYLRAQGTETGNAWYLKMIPKP